MLLGLILLGLPQLVDDPGRAEDMLQSFEDRWRRDMDISLPRVPLCVFVAGARQVMLWFHEQNLELPVKHTKGQMEAPELRHSQQDGPEPRLRRRLSGARQINVM